MLRNRGRYKSGEIIRIRLESEIRRRLDPHFGTDGCLFMAGMWKFCGQSIRVIKPVSYVYDEYRGLMCRTKFPLYILDGAICDGSSGEFVRRCDRTCYFLWHEDWLEPSGFV